MLLFLLGLSFIIHLDPFFWDSLVNQRIDHSLAMLALHHHLLSCLSR